MRNIVFGTVDAHNGCLPFDENSKHVKMRLVLTSVPFHGFRLPALRKAIRIGIFLESQGDVYEMPRIVLITDGDKPLRIKPKRLQYRMAVNAMGGEFFSLQTYQECRVYPRFGLFLGTIDLEYGLFSRPQAVSMTAHWFNWPDHYEKTVKLHSL